MCIMTRLHTTQPFVTKAIKRESISPDRRKVQYFVVPGTWGSKSQSTTPLAPGGQRQPNGSVQYEDNYLACGQVAPVQPEAPGGPVSCWRRGITHPDTLQPPPVVLRPRWSHPIVVLQENLIPVWCGRMLEVICTMQGKIVRNPIICLTDRILYNADRRPYTNLKNVVHFIVNFFNNNDLNLKKKLIHYYKSFLRIRPESGDKIYVLYINSVAHRMWSDSH